MNFAAIIHEPKSRMSYAFNEETIQLRIKIAKNDADKVTVRAVDPFNWAPCKDNPEVYAFDVDSIVDIPMVKEYTTQYHDVWFANISGFLWARIRYGFIIEGSEEKYFFGCHYTADLMANEKEAENVWNYFNFPYINNEDIYQAPKWVEDTIWYQIFPYSFSADGNECDDNHHGTLEGIIKKLDYIREMGFNGIYFTPIFKSPSAHKYDTTDYFHIDESFGTNEIFEKLVTQAHKRGIRIMLDAVFNHCGYEHSFWQSVLKDGKASPYYDCFYIIDKDKAPQDTIWQDGRQCCNYRTFAFEPSMPKWNTGNKLVREYLIEAAVFWTEKYHIDGWRLDVSNEVSHDFWREFRKAVKTVNPELYILGENWDNSMPWLAGDQFDAVMNYEFMDPVWNFIGIQSPGKERKRVINAEQFKNAIGELMASYPKPLTQMMFNLLESHDTCRLITVCKNRMAAAKLAYVIQMTFAGCPSIYYGGEVGMTGGENDNRKPMYWSGISRENLELKAHIRKLIHIRKAYSCCKSTQMQWLCADNPSGTLIYEKQSKDCSMYVIIHNSDKDASIELPMPLKNKSFKDIYGGSRLALGEAIILKPYTFYLLMDDSAVSYKN